MKKVILILTVALFTMSCACSNKKDKNKDTETEKTTVSKEDSSKAKPVGAFADQKTVTKEDKLVFDEALKIFKTTNKYTALTVAKQVVAGTNYSFICDVVAKDGAKSQEKVLIFKPLPHTKKPAEVVKASKVK